MPRGCEYRAGVGSRLPLVTSEAHRGLTGAERSSSEKGPCCQQGKAMQATHCHWCISFKCQHSNQAYPELSSSAHLTVRHCLFLLTRSTQNMPLGHKEYLELRTTEIQQMRGKFSHFLLQSSLRSCSNQDHSLQAYGGTYRPVQYKQELRSKLLHSWSTWFFFLARVPR